MQTVSIQNKTEKEGFTDNGKDVEKRSSSAVCVVEAYFDNRVKPSVPNYPFGKNLAFLTVKSKRNRNRNRNFFQHFSKKTRNLDIRI